MSFWENVESEREYLGLSRKELAYLADFSVNTISTGLKRKGMPNADLALKISKVLNVPLEKLLNQQSNQNVNEESILRRNKLYAKYSELINKLEELDPETVNSIMLIINKL